MKTWLVIPFLLLLGCKNPEVVQLSPGVYFLSRSDRGGIFSNFSSFKAGVIQEANDFALARGMVAIPVSMQETPLAPGRLAKVEYQFRLVPPGSPETKQVNALLPSAPIQRIEQKVEQKTESRDTTPQKKDVYAEILKLADLKAKGLLTEEEFQTQKKKLLESN